MSRKDEARKALDHELYNYLSGGVMRTCIRKAIDAYGAACAAEALGAPPVRSDTSETEAELRASVAALVRCGDRLRDVAEHPESCSLLEDGPGSCDCDCGLEEAQERWRWVVYEAVERGGKRLLANARNAQEKQAEKEPKR